MQLIAWFDLLRLTRLGSSPKRRVKATDDIPASNEIFVTF